MQKIPFLIFSTTLVLLTACSGDELDIPNQSLQGLVEGEFWSYGLANAYQLPGGQQYRVRFISESEPVSDPCSLPAPGLTHVKAIFRPAIGDFSIAPFALDNNQVQVAFETPPSKSITAVSGFMSIFDINSGTVVGYLQAELDDGNSVEGAFRISICD